MGSCMFCKKETCLVSNEVVEGKYVFLCPSCWREGRKKDRTYKIEESLRTINKAEDFKSWKKENLSEAFWIHLGKYQKCPNRRSLEIMHKAYLWAVHDDHGLANSFSNALKWCKINISNEMKRKDLPKKWEEEK